MKFFRFLTLIVSLAFPCVLLGQSTNASLTGVVDDSSKAVIPGVSITAINTETGVRSQTLTNSSGQYVLPTLNPGSYRIEVDKEGFRGIIEAGLVLHVQDVIQMNFHMALGSSSETVTVNANSLQLNTTDASVSTVIDRTFVENMPLNGRSFQDLISMTPGVVTQTPQTVASIGNNGDFSVNGQRTESNYYSVDGVSANTGSGYPSGYAQSATGGTIAASTALGTTQALLSVDALQEFRVQSSTYSAEYGRSPGGQFSFVTRSGTNQLHGGIFEYLRNNYFDANNWFNDYYGTPEPALRQNDFGGTLGGPVLIPKLYDGRNRSFFFVSYEGLRLTLPQAASLQYVPSNSLRQASQVSSTVIASILNAFPLPTGSEATIACNNTTYACPTGQPVGTSVASGLAQLVRSYALPSQIDSTSARIDQTISPKLALFFRFGDTPSSSSTRNLSTSDRLKFSILNYTLGATSQFTPALSNEARFGLTYGKSPQSLTLDNFGGAVPIDLAGAMGANGYSSAFPEFYLYISGVRSSYIYTEAPHQSNNQWNLVDTLSLNVRKHQIKVGFDYRRISSPLSPVSPSVFAEFTSSASVIANSAALLSISKYNQANPIFHQAALFAQDDWRIVPALSLSMGIRWEVSPPPGATSGELPYTLEGNVGDPSSLSVAPAGTSLWHTTYHNFAPRLGVAWTAHNNPGWETVVRAGGGVFFDSDNQFSTQGFWGLGFSATNSLSRVPLPATSSELGFGISVTAPYEGTSVYAFPSHLQLPYSLQWNTTVEQALGAQQSLTMSYVGSNGRRLVNESLLSVATLNPNLAATIYYFSGNLTSNYQALQVKFQRSIRRGIQALASYSWAHSLDYGSTGQSLPATRASSDFDVRNNFQAGISWDIGQTYRNKWANAVLAHWSLDGRVLARSGFPITLTGSLFLDPQGNYYYGGLNYKSGVAQYLYGSQYPGGWRLNPAAFVANTSGNSNGDVPRNHFRGFDATQVNTAVRREFPLHDEIKLQFRAEAFNILNHPIFGYVDPTLSDSTFGEATKTLNQSLGSVASQYQQGGPRSMQFALKVLF